MVGVGDEDFGADTDHLWGIGGSARWVWKCFTRGLNPIFMDPYRNSPHHATAALDPQWDPLRRAMGQTQVYARRVDLAHLMPTDDSKLCSTRYCLRNPAREYLVYQPGSGPLSLQLEPGRYRFEWFDPGQNKVAASGLVQWRGGVRRFTPPVGGAAVLYLVVAKGTAH